MTDHGPFRAFPSSAIDPEYGGAELRDIFAIAITAAVIIRDENAWDNIPEEAYRLADMMMAYRNKEPRP